MKQIDPNTVLTAEHLPANLLRSLQRVGFGTIGMLQLLSRREVARIVQLSPASSECAIIIDRCLHFFSESLRLRNDRESYARRAKMVFPNPGDISVSYLFLQGMIGEETLEVALASPRSEPKPLSTYGEMAEWGMEELTRLLNVCNKPHFDRKTLKAIDKELRLYGLSLK